LWRQQLGPLVTIFDQGKWCPIDPFVSLGPEEPKGEPAGVVVCPRCLRPWGDFGPNAQRTLSAGRLPSKAFHNHPNHDADRLSQPLGAAGVLGGKKVIDRGLRLKLTHNPRQGGSVVVDLGLLHAALSVFAVEEVKYSVERLLRIIQHVSECPALTILKEVVTGEGRCRHLGLQWSWVLGDWTCRIGTCKIRAYNYCNYIAGNGKG
jgi:hypothetical protein